MFLSNKNTVIKQQENHATMSNPHYEEIDSITKCVTHFNFGIFNSTSWFLKKIKVLQIRELATKNKEL